MKTVALYILLLYNYYQEIFECLLFFLCKNPYSLESRFVWYCVRV